MSPSYQFVTNICPLSSLGGARVLGVWRGGVAPSVDFLAADRFFAVPCVGGASLAFFGVSVAMPKAAKRVRVKYLQPGSGVSASQAAPRPVVGAWRASAGADRRDGYCTPASSPRRNLGSIGGLGAGERVVDAPPLTMCTLAW